MTTKTPKTGKVMQSQVHSASNRANDAMAKRMAEREAARQANETRGK